MIVSDNNSIDNTNEIVNDFKFVYYLKNKVNIGYDANVCNLINRAEGYYIWILSDDDELGIDALNNIYNILKNKQIDLYYMEPRFFKNKHEDGSNNFHEKIYKDANEALRDASWLISFVSSWIMKQNFCRKELGSFMGLGFIHTPIILDIMSHGKTARIEGNTIFARMGNSSSYDKYLYFGPNFRYIITKFEKNFKKEQINYLLKMWIKKCLIGNIYEDKKNNKFKLRDAYNIATAYYDLSYFWTRVLWKMI